MKVVRNLVMLLTGMMGNAVPGWLITYFHVLSCFNNKSMHFKSPLSIEIWAQNTGWESSSTNIIVVWNYWDDHHKHLRIPNSEFFQSFTPISSSLLQVWLEKIFVKFRNLGFEIRENMWWVLLSRVVIICKIKVKPA